MAFFILGDDDPSVNLVPTADDDDEREDAELDCHGGRGREGDGDNKDDLLAQILTEVDGFLQEERSSPKRKRARREIETKEQHGNLHSLQTKLQDAETRATTFQRRFKELEKRNLDFLAETKEREACWFEEKHVMEEEIMALKLSSKSGDVKVAEKLRDTLRTIREMRSAQQGWKAKETELVASASTLEKQRKKLEVSLASSEDIVKELRAENLLLRSERVKVLKGRDGDENQAPAESERSMAQISQLERSKRQLERELKSLKEHHPNQEILQTKYDEIEEKFEKAQAKLLKFEQGHVHYDHLIRQQEEWDELFRSLMKDQNREGVAGTYDETTATPMKVMLLLGQLQDGQKVTAKMNKVLQKRLAELEKENTTLKGNASASKSLENQTAQQFAIAEERYRRLKSQCAFLEKQNSSLKSVLQSFADEQDAAVVAQDGEDETAFTERKQLLMAVLKNSDTQWRSVAKEMSASPSPAAHSALRRRMAKLEIELKEKDDENVRLKKERLKLDEIIGRLEMQVGRGEYNKQTTKVLHMRINPAAKAKEDETKRLKDEISRLRAEVSNGKKSSDCASSAEQAANAKLVENLKKKNERLKEVFKNMTSRFKTAVYQLTGWKVDMEMLHGKPIVLRSIFAEKESDRIEFHMADSGDIQLLETPFARQVDEKTFFFLTTCKSPPAFLSKLTLELFEKTTMTGTGSIM